MQNVVIDCNFFRACFSGACYW